MGAFSNKSKKQGPGVYRGPNADQAATKDAELNDYWQFSAKPTSKQSGRRAIDRHREETAQHGPKLSLAALQSLLNPLDQLFCFRRIGPEGLGQVPGQQVEGGQFLGHARST
jgi:hypothetical protein